MVRLHQISRQRQRTISARIQTSRRNLTPNTGKARRIAFWEAALATAPASFPASFNPIPAFKQAGFTPTSGFRTQAHQNALRAQGLTQTRTGQHPLGNAMDFGVPSGWSKEQAISWVRQNYPGARVIPSNGNAIHVTFPGWGHAPDISGSRGRYGG